MTIPPAVKLGPRTPRINYARGKEPDAVKSARRGCEDGVKGASLLIAHERTRYLSAMLAIERVGRVTVLTLQGRLVTEQALELKPKLDTYAAGRPGDTLLDMSRVVYFSSYLVGVLVSLRSTLHEQGAKCHLVGLDPKARFVLKVSALEDLFTYHATREEALSAMET
jgi:anti-anti-sigma factor